MAASIVQTAINGKNGGGTSVTATFASAPTPGNILLWIVSRYSPRSTVPNPGPGWAQYVASTQGNAAVDVYGYTVQPGDGTTWEMDELFGTDSMTACIVEVAGSDGNPGAWLMPSTGVFASPLSQSVTGTAGQLLIVGVAPNGGSTFGGLTDITPSGYTEDAEFVPAGSSLSVGHTTATGAAQSIGASWDGSNGDCVQVVIAVTSVSVSSRWHVGVIGMRALEPIPLAAPGVFAGELGGPDAGASGQVARSYTSEHDSLLILGVVWATAANTSHTMTITDTGGLTWVKLGEVVLDNTANPTTLAAGIFAARTPSTPTSGTVTVTVPAHATFDVYPFTYATATAAGDVASGHAVTGSGLSASGLTLTLGTAPTAEQGTFILYANWPHRTITADAAYTVLIDSDNPGGSGPFFQQFRFDYSDNLSSPSDTATFTNAATVDTVAVMITITPDLA